MGDRSNIVIEDYSGGRVYLYSHWSGETAIKSAVHGLGSGRYNDPSYLARIVFEDLISSDLGQETGFGISTQIEDNEHPVFVISNNSGKETRVWFEDSDKEELTDRVPRPEFLSIIESIDDWAELAESNTLYEVLIHRMSENKN